MLDILANHPVSCAQDSSWTEWVGVSYRGTWEPTSVYVFMYVWMQHVWSADTALEQNQERTELPRQRYRRPLANRVKNLVPKVFSLLQGEAWTTCFLFPGNGVTLLRQLQSFSKLWTYKQNRTQKGLVPNLQEAVKNGSEVNNSAVSSQTRRVLTIRDFFPLL